MKLKATIAQDDAYRAVFAEGAAAMANQVEAAIYSCADTDELLADLRRLIESARALASS
jgi:hypothetical protein